MIGPNGAGKTTVFNIITGVYRPTDGSITFENAPIAGLKPSAIADAALHDVSEHSFVSPR
jgi:branched-chain amino acid transport system ATP-binding protein